MLKELVIAIQAYFKAHQFIVKHKLWKWIFIPGFLYMLMFMGGIWLFWNSSTSFLDWLFNVVGIKSWLDAMNNSFLNFLFITGTIIFRGVDADYASQRDVSRTKRDIKTFEVRLRCDNRDRVLAVGMTAYVVLPFAN